MLFVSYSMEVQKQKSLLGVIWTPTHLCEMTNLIWRLLKLAAQFQLVLNHHFRHGKASFDRSCTNQMYLASNEAQNANTLILCTKSATRQSVDSRTCAKHDKIYHPYHISCARSRQTSQFGGVCWCHRQTTVGAAWGELGDVINRPDENDKNNK